MDEYDADRFDEGDFYYENGDLAVCERCGFAWDAGFIPATHLDPPEARFPDCPHCESGYHDSTFGDPQSCEYCHAGRDYDESEWIRLSEEIGNG